MHPRTQEIIDHLDAAREDLRRAVHDVPTELRERRPMPDRWSVAEVLEHLALVESRIAALVASRVTAARSEGLSRETDDGSILESPALANVTDRSRRLRAGATAQPSGTATADIAWARLADTRAGLTLAVFAADGWALETITHPHPALGVLNLYQWMAFVGSHEARHAAQIRETGEALAQLTP